MPNTSAAPCPSADLANTARIELNVTMSGAARSSPSSRKRFIIVPKTPLTFLAATFRSGHMPQALITAL
eukprot:CAMPEP_0172512116 /NCGR_PEP_ID=MMETSP1066-20121228/241808_1 /TAXON_ID=671091 /ORGANISM="Coscinodiscus wailesii, Strain CCMP2513" /LENGTH=68 /DNA_ID=CAMNT_0013291769 /DNA_START=165 /DNA_END=371 /DNA_ORIENTATION=-